MNTTGWHAALEADVQLTVKNTDANLDCAFVENSLYFIDPFNNGWDNSLKGKTSSNYGHALLPYALYFFLHRSREQSEGALSITLDKHQCPVC